MTALLGALFLGIAHAGVPVLHNGEEPDAARARGARFAAVGPDDIDLHTISSLAGPLPPFTARSSPLRTCTEDTVPSAERTAEALRISIRDVLHDEALDIGGRLLDLLPCQAAGADRHDLALSWYRYGYVLALERQHDAARDAFEQAVVFDPELTWDADLAPDGAPTFNSARDAVRSAAAARLTISPRPAVLRVDGTDIPADAPIADLAPGWHIVELGPSADTLTPYAIDLEAGTEEALLVPDLVQDTALDAIIEGDLLLGTVVDKALPPYAPAWAVQGRQVYTRPTAGAPWQPAEPPRDRLPSALRWTAVGATGVGAILLGTGGAMAITAVRDASQTTDATEFDAAKGRYSTGQSLYQVGWGALALGGVSGVSAVLLKRTW
jgi:tetratricopeptide (TPR) repeat protein